MENNRISSSSNRVEGNTADQNNSAARWGSVSPSGQASTAPPADAHNPHVHRQSSPSSSPRSSSRSADDDRPSRLRRDRSRSPSSQRSERRGASKRQRSRSRRDSSFSSRSPRSAVSPSSSSSHSSSSRNSCRRRRSASRSSRRKSPSSSSTSSSTRKGGDGDERDAYMDTDAGERRKARNRRKREKRREKRRTDDRRKRHPYDSIAGVRGLGEKLMPIVIGTFGGQYSAAPQTADGRHIHHHHQQHGGFAQAAPINPWCVSESSIEVAALLSSADEARTNTADSSDPSSNLMGASLCRRIVVPYGLPLAQTTFLDLVAVHVAAGGPAVEDEVKIREAHNPYFAFLHANWQDPAAVYYRWRLYSLLQGDTLTHWRTRPFVIETRGGADRTSEEGDKAPSMPHVWIPPPMPAVTRGATSERRESPTSHAASTIHAPAASAPPLIVTEAEAIHATRPNIRSLLSVLRTPESATTSSAPPPSSYSTQILLAVKRERLAAIEVLRGGTRTLEAATKSVLSSNIKSLPKPTLEEESSKTAASMGRGGGGGGGALSSLLEDAFLVPDLPLGPRGAAQSRQQQQQQPPKPSASNRPPSDDLLEITCEEAESLIAAFYPSQQPHSGQQIHTQKADRSCTVALAYLPTAPVVCSASAPFFLLEVRSQNNPTPPPSSPSAAVGGRGAPVFTPAASASAPTAGWLASSMMQREKAFFPFLTAKDEALLRGASLPLPTSEEDVMVFPLTSCATVNLNTLGRVRSVCMLYMLRRSKRYARSHHDRDRTHTTVAVDYSVGKGGGKGATVGGASARTTRLESYEALVTGSDVKKLVQRLMIDAPDVSVPIEESDEILRLRETINSRLAAYLLLSPQKRESFFGGSSSSAGVSPACFPSRTFDPTYATDTFAPPPTRTSQGAHPLISLIDIISYVFAAFGHLFAADDLPISDADDNTDNTNSPVEETDSLRALANTQRFHSVLLQRALLDKAYIGELAALLLRHHRCAQHALSILLDEAIRVGQLPAELMQLIAFLSGNAVLQSPEAQRIAAILDSARARTNASTDDSTTTANVNVMGQQLALSALLLQAIPHRIASMHTYALQSLLFVLNDLVFMANALSSNNPDNNSGGGSSAWVDLCDVPPTAVSPSGAAIADVLAKSAPPPLSAAALPPTALSSMVASYKAASDRRHHQAVAKAISALSSPRLQVMAAVEMIFPSIVEVFSSYALAVGALTGSIADLVASPSNEEGHANQSNYNHQHQGYGAPPSLTSSISQIPNLQPVSLRGQSVSPIGGTAAIDAFLASQLVQWLRTLLFEWYQRRYYNTRRYQALVMKAAFLSQ